MNTVISVKIDKEVKIAAQAMAKDMGLTLSTLINAYLRQVVATRRVELYAPEKMAPHLEKLISKVELDIKKNGSGPAFHSVEDFVAGLKK